MGDSEFSSTKARYSASQGDFDVVACTQMGGESTLYLISNSKSQQIMSVAWLSDMDITECPFPTSPTAVYHIVIGTPGLKWTLSMWERKESTTRLIIRWGRAALDSPGTVFRRGGLSPSKYDCQKVCSR